MANVNGLPAQVSVAAPVGTAGSSNVAGATGRVSVAAPFGMVFGDQEYYTENLCPNPSFETDLSGYVALTGTTLTQETTQGFSGRSSMKVVTDGSRSSEGFTAAQATVPNTDTGSMSFYIMGETGTVTVAAISGSTATVIAQTQVTLSGGDYQRVALSGLSLVAGQQMYLLVQTTTAQALTFWVDAFQYEMNATPHPYIDGSFKGCQWEGTAHESASFQQFQFMLSATGGMFLEGRATPVVEGEVFTISASGQMLLSGTEHGTLVINPVGALADFGIWTAADFDPAVSYIEWSNAGQSSGSNAWQRVYGLAYPPQQALASDGSVIWNRAAYAALGFTFKSVLNNGQQALADVQFEKMPVSPGSNPVPTSYQPARAISTVIKPSRLNFCPNPSIEVSTAGWTVIGTATVSQDAAKFVVGTGTHSLKVVVNAANDGAYLVIPNLIIGDTYIVSASVQGGAGLLDVTMACGGSSVSSANQGVPYGGNAILGIGYGQGPYGGIQATGSDMPTGQWFLPSAVFTATQSTVVLSFQALVGSDVAYPTSFWVDAILLEEGETLGAYFDGSTSGTDYTWEGGGTAGLTRSYYYQRQNVAAGAVTTALAEHTPLGIVAATPVYSQPYSQ
jgi:hypothetical protein